MTLADSSVISVDLYSEFVSWHDAMRPVEIVATDVQPSIGMALLSKSRLTINVREGGAVSIISLY